MRELKFHCYIDSLDRPIFNYWLLCVNTRSCSSYDVRNTEVVDDVTKSAGPVGNGSVAQLRWRHIWQRRKSKQFIQSTPNTGSPGRRWRCHPCSTDYCRSVYHINSDDASVIYSMQAFYLHLLSIGLSRHFYWHWKTAKDCVCRLGFVHYCGVDEANRK